MNKSLFFTLILLAVTLLSASLLFVGFNRAGLRVSEDTISVLAQDIVRGEGSITVPALSERLVEGRKDFMLIDVRPQPQYQQRHIRTASHMPVTELLKPDSIAGLPTDRDVILYSGDTTSAAQAAVILRMSGIPAYSLIGGYHHWTAYMTDPAAAGIAEADAARLAKYDAIRCYLEGDYIAEAGLEVRQQSAAGFTPPLQAVEPNEDDGDPLGLGLGLGLEPEIPDTDEIPGAGSGVAPTGLKLGEGC